MPAPVVDQTNIINKMSDLEAEAAEWRMKRDSSKGPDRLVAVTALTHIERKLKWLRGRAEGKKPEEAFTHGGRKKTKALNTQKLAEARS